MCENDYSEKLNELNSIVLGKLFDVDRWNQDREILLRNVIQTDKEKLMGVENHKISNANLSFNNI